MPSWMIFVICFEAKDKKKHRFLAAIVVVQTPSKANISNIRQRVSASKSSTSTYKSGYIPVTDNGSSASLPSVVDPTSKTLDNNQAGSEKNLDAIFNAITSLGERIKHLEAVPPVLQQANQLDEDPDEESADEDFTGKHWGLTTIKEIRRNYEVGDRLSVIGDKNSHEDPGS
ncbi:predicted protein [Naegleria gruberi]|uniref:Predicted protein n=1 Tax=Naegleria gruberi TaxID=5762 RepID=D2W1Y5_NAEGR|nr:uncharacterized protein NAEGRDRAFT_75393 [Naegleria gruberi]EFC36847.1 predicted protein [Naegleria gruberi]|eukprot:XP_002669591.1 predicted protein [Naegleria gruberi strain NEG-M]